MPWERPVLVSDLREGPVWLHPVALDVPPSEVRMLSALLSADERRRAVSYRFAVDRDRFIVARARLRQILAGHGAGVAERLVLGVGQYGKPRLASSASLRFSVSHSGGSGLVATAFDREVGVDLEILRPLRDVGGLARRWFTSAEAAAITEREGGDRLAAFYRCWVRKEACIKAAGLGLHQELEAFEVGVEPSSGSRLVRLPTTGEAFGREWTLSDLDLGTREVGALAVEGVSEV